MAWMKHVLMQRKRNEVRALRDESGGRQEKDGGSLSYRRAYVG